MTISTLTVNNTLGNSNSYYKGAFFYIEALASASVTSASLTTTSNLFGDGVFIYYNTDSDFSLTVSSSSYISSTTSNTQSISTSTTAN